MILEESRIKHREAVRRYKLKHPEKIKEQKRLYSIRHRQKKTSFGSITAKVKVYDDYLKDLAARKKSYHPVESSSK